MTTDSADEQPRRIPVWAIPLVIGLVTITAGVFTWRAGQLGSSAAFQDRQSVGQTISEQQVEVEARLKGLNDAVAYVRYRADFAEAAALDALALELDAEQDGRLAASLRSDATQLRAAASTLAEAAGVFGQQTLLNEVVTSTDVPVGFDLDRQIEQLEAELTTGIGTPGELDPDRWAAMADETRERVRGLRFSTFLLLISVVALTVAQLTDRRSTRWAGAGVGSILFLGVVATTIVTVY